MAEWTTMSAPHSIGRIRYGVASVLSTISGTPFSWAMLLTPSMSSTSWRGLETTSPKNALVFGLHRVAPLLQVVRILDERHFDAELAQRVRSRL